MGGALLSQWFTRARGSVSRKAGRMLQVSMLHPGAGVVKGGAFSPWHLWHRLFGVPGSGVRVWQLTSWGRGPRGGRPPAESANVRYPLTFHASMACVIDRPRDCHA